jgi:hypothetical protein
MPLRNRKKQFTRVTSDIVGKYHDIFTRESEKSAIKQLFYLHYENLQILEINAPHFPPFGLDFSYHAANLFKKSELNRHLSSCVALYSIWLC